MKFSREKFECNADKTILRLVPKEHRVALDGKEVVNNEIKYKVGMISFIYFLFIQNGVRSDRKIIISGK